MAPRKVKTDQPDPKRACDVCGAEGKRHKIGPAVCSACHLFTWRVEGLGKFHICRKGLRCPVNLHFRKCSACRYLKYSRCWIKSLKEAKDNSASENEMLQIKSKLKLVKFISYLTNVVSRMVVDRAALAPQVNGDGGDHSEDTEGESEDSSLSETVSHSDELPSTSSSSSGLGHGDMEWKNDSTDDQLQCGDSEDDSDMSSDTESASDGESQSSEEEIHFKGPEPTGRATIYTPDPMLQFPSSPQVASASPGFDMGAFEIPEELVRDDLALESALFDCCEISIKVEDGRV